MAWTEQCKLAFYANCHNRVIMAVGRKKISMNKVFRELSKESGIPFKTLECWYYAMRKETRKEFLKTQEHATAENNEENKNEGRNKLEPLKCTECGSENIKKHTTTGKPYGKKSIYYGLCITCFRRLEIERAKGKLIVCPHCNKQFRYKEGGNNNGTRS